MIFYHMSLECYVYVYTYVRNLMYKSLNEINSVLNARSSNAFAIEQFCTRDNVIIIVSGHVSVIYFIVLFTFPVRRIRVVRHPFSKESVGAAPWPTRRTRLPSFRWRRILTPTLFMVDNTRFNLSL